MKTIGGSQSMDDANSFFVANGGWVLHETVGRPKARFLGFLSLMWLPVSVGAWSCVSNAWPDSMETLEWMLLSLMALHPIFILAAVVLAIVEIPKPITQYRDNPDYDLQNLY